MQPDPKSLHIPSAIADFDFKTDFLPLLDATIVHKIRRRTRQATALSPNYGRLWSYIETIFMAGGKRLRPSLAYASYRALSPQKTNLTAFLEVAAAIEFIHLALLIHDDIIDHDQIRHGQANLSGLYRHHYQAIYPRLDTDHAADSAALLGGDVLISEAYNIIMSANITAEQKQAISAAFSTALFEVIGGELLDTEAVFQTSKDVDYHTIALLKTAGYSCTMPLLVGALLADASPAVLDTIGVIGSSIGIAFQMADDELGIFGDETVTGKSSNSDIREGKRTLLLKTALHMATPSDRKQLMHILTQPELSIAMTTTYRTIVKRSGARAAHAAERQKYTQQALDAVAQLPISKAAVQELSSFLRTLSERVA